MDKKQPRSFIPVLCSRDVNIIEFKHFPSSTLFLSSLLHLFLMTPPYEGFCFSDDCFVNSVCELYLN